MSDPTTGDHAAVQQGYAVRNFIDADQLKRDISFNLLDLSNAMMEQASLFVYYGSLAADAEKQVSAVKLMLETTEAAIYQAVRSNKIANDERFTEALLENEVSRHPRVISIKKSLADARRVESTCKTAVEAFRHRKDMLIQQGLITREEMKGQTFIKGQDQAEATKQAALDRISAK